MAEPMVMRDGVHLGDHLLVVVIGVTDIGTKVPLGVVEGSADNTAVCARLVAGLVDRGLVASRGVLLVIDRADRTRPQLDDVACRLAALAGVDGGAWRAEHVTHRRQRSVEVEVEGYRGRFFGGIWSPRLSIIAGAACRGRGVL